MKLDFVAQLVEQLTLNQWVEGSSPSEVTVNHSSMLEAPCISEELFFWPMTSHFFLYEGAFLSL